MQRILLVQHIGRPARSVMGRIIYVNSEEQNRDYAFVVNKNWNSDRTTFSVGGVSLFMLIDSGVMSNMVDEITWEMLKAKKIRFRSPLTYKKLYAYSSSKPLPVKGVFTCQKKIGKCSTQAEFTVKCGRRVPYLGKENAIKLGVLKVGVDMTAVTDVKTQIKQPEVFLF